ncbi:universal stress protein [Paeniglutamicibacter kerguelensis]|uniref:Nucleotide-binding universal stress UspA family protein n=1 Tax=Paeniglutamicibacter kerguelensis TaxID=254788 RepID=A0ABS4XAR3_9MICC|nr:universal stress protein [Paeniglutamicibacter kerguelensis]MBP2385559.1 nucleotide-binding universal stress UspA family protein [Paeniglutamicibacter kerguelensis]
MSKEPPHVGGAGPILAGAMPKQPRRVVLEARALAESLGTALVFAYVEPNSYRADWELKEDIQGNSLNPKQIDEEMTSDVADIMRVLESCMAGSQTTWSLKVLAGDAGNTLAHLADELHARMIVVGTRHKGVGARLTELLSGSTASHVIAHQSLPVVVVPVHHEDH